MPEGWWRFPIPFSNLSVVNSSFIPIPVVRLAIQVTKERRELLPDMLNGPLDMRHLYERMWQIHFPGLHSILTLFCALQYGDGGTGWRQGCAGIGQYYL